MSSMFAGRGPSLALPSWRRGVVVSALAAAGTLAAGCSGARSMPPGAGAVAPATLSVRFVAPQDSARARNQIAVDLHVTGPIPTVTTTLTVRGMKVPLIAGSETATVGGYLGNVRFDDPRFGTPLRGRQMLVATARERSGRVVTARRTFIVDDVGPSLEITSHKAGDAIGGVATVTVKVRDPGGVASGGVRCTIGNSQDSARATLDQSATDAQVYSGKLDVRRLPARMVLPTLTCVAADTAGNVASQSIQLGLDLGPPIASLDPPTGATRYDRGVAQVSYFHSRKRSERGTDVTACSAPFDPVGAEAANDLDVVPQLTVFRARIEDQGAGVPAAKALPVSGIAEKSARLYLLDDTRQPLVVDTTGDGWCDAINPAVVPAPGSARTAAHAVAVALSAITPRGSADFTPVGPSYSGKHPFPGCSQGIDLKRPTPLCRATSMTIAVGTRPGDVTPAIFGVGPFGAVLTSSTCLGRPVDLRAHRFENRSWACAAVAVADQVGNLGVSPPLRLYVDYGSRPLGASRSGRPRAPASPPTCRGTYSKGVGSAAKPCRMRTASSINAATCNGGAGRRDCFAQDFWPVEVRGPLQETRTSLPK